ncbi:MAG: PEP/pyruvate-binding domain-containing protein, partial [Myxococcota bacterium]|nr:PEP/pyruvate-binding domain-containing protein [Myxococcota bacterium]
MSTGYVFGFGGGKADGRGDMKAVLGGKGAGLAEMTSLGLPVPPGFTISTEACAFFFENDESWPDGLWEDVLSGVTKVEALTGKTFGDPSNPLLFSVRSGAAVSMPGMMDTVLNLGLNRETVAGLAARSGNAVFAWDSYRRFIQMFGDVVLGIHYTRFARVADQYRAGREEQDLDADGLEALCGRLEAVVVDSLGAFPADPHEQLRLAITAVFRSFNTP